jgi:hypothetical protein
LTRPADEDTPPSPPPRLPDPVGLPAVEQASTPLARAQMLAEVMDYVI